MKLNRKNGIGVAIVCICLFLVSCGGDESSITSGGGGSGVTSDGGSSSAKFAGTYTGTVTISAKGSEVDNTKTRDAVLVIRSNGTATLTIDGETIQGTINGDRFGFSVKVIEEDGLVECDADAVLNGRISSGRGTGMIVGSGKCEVLTAKTGFDVTGSINVSR